MNLAGLQDIDEIGKTAEEILENVDTDGDGSITPDELISILPSLGETPGDLSLFFDGMSEDTITNHKQICDFLTFLIQNGIIFYKF